MKRLLFLSKTIYEAYQRLLSRTYEGDKNLALKIMSWLYRAQRPLLIDELREALTVQPVDSQLNLEALTPRQDIIECCEGLVVLENTSDTVRFIHRTVKEFLQKEHMMDLLSGNDISEICLTYLPFDEFDNDCIDFESAKKRAEKFKFCRYAAQFGGFYTREAEESPAVQAAVLTLLSSKKKKNSMLQPQAYMSCGWNGDSNFDEGQTLLHVIAAQTSNYLQHRPSWNSRWKSCVSPCGCYLG